MGLAACANLSQPNMNPSAIPVTGDTSRFVGDTLIFAYFDRRPDSLAGDAARLAIGATMRAAFPSAFVLESTVDTTSSLRRVFVETTLIGYGPSWEGKWVGHTAIDVFIHDYRLPTGRRRFVKYIRTTSSSSPFFSRGNKTMGDVSRASFDSANIQLIAFLDSVGSPTAGDHLQANAAVSEADYAPYLGTTGTSSITGRASLAIRHGEVKRATNRMVTLDPATSSARRWYERSGMSWTDFGSCSPDDLFRRARRTTVTDIDGRFSFNDLAPGTYLVRTTVTWEGPDPHDLFGTVTYQGALVAEFVTLAPGQRAEVVLHQVGPTGSLVNDPRNRPENKLPHCGATNLK